MDKDSCHVTIDREWDASARHSHKRRCLTVTIAPAHQTCGGRDMAMVQRATLARGVLGVTTFFEETSPSGVRGKDNETKAPADGRSLRAGSSGGWMGATDGLRE